MTVYPLPPTRECYNCHFKPHTTHAPCVSIPMGLLQNLSVRVIPINPNHSARLSTLLCSDERADRKEIMVMKKNARRRRKHCALAVVRQSLKFLPRRGPPSRGRGTAKNLISWRWSLPLPTDPVCEDRCMQLQVILVTVNGSSLFQALGP